MRRGAPAPWRYRGYSADTENGAFGPLAPFVDVWRRKATIAGEFPSWDAFSRADLDAWWDQISVAEILRDPLDLRWIQWGAKNIEWWGADYTGQRISEMPAARDIWFDYERTYFEQFLERRAIGYVSGTLEPETLEFNYIIGVDLPLESAGQISHCLSAYILCAPSEAFVPLPEPSFTV